MKNMLFPAFFLCWLGRPCRALAGLLLYGLLLAGAGAQTQTVRESVRVWVPNGYLTVRQDDLVLQSTAGPVRWARTWDGHEWTFNPQWESLSQSWKNLTGSQSADGPPVSGSPGSPLPDIAGGTQTGCWVWVDEDWQPTIGQVFIGGVPDVGPAIASRTTPFNRVMGETQFEYAAPVLVDIDYASLCVGIVTAYPNRAAEGLRRINQLYLGEAGRYAFDSRSIIEKRSVRQVVAVGSDTIYSRISNGSASFATETNPKGFRWQDRSGDWIDYNTQGQMVARGDSNNNAILLVRDTGGILRAVVDDRGRVLFSLHYTDQLVTEVRDYPVAGLAQDLPQRSVKYTYDERNRLTQVIDARGYAIKYEYDVGNHITKIIDQEGHAETFSYNGDLVKQHVLPDGAVWDYEFGYDDVNKQFNSKITGPQTAAGRRVEQLTHNRSNKLVRQVVNGRVDAEVRYDTGARTVLETNARGFTTRTTRNEFDQVTDMVYPDGSLIKNSYSALHLNMTERLDELGVKTTYRYDDRFNLIQMVEAADLPDQRVTDYEVNSLGQVVRMTRRGRTEANGAISQDAIWQIDYDARGQINKVINSEGAVRQYVFDRAGNLVRYTDPRSNVTLYTVDAAGNLVKAVDALNRTFTYSYDKVGNELLMSDGRSKLTRSTYDTMNRRAQTTNPVGGVYKMQYNGHGLPIVETDEDGRTARAEFDNFLRVSKEIDGLGNVTEYGYNIPDGNGTGTLGAMHYPTEIKYPTYTKQRRYDQRERSTASTQLNPNSLGIEGLVTGATYDKRGQIKTRTDANGKTRFYSYDALQQLAEATDSLGNKISAMFDVRGNLIQITDPNNRVSKFEYDRNSRLVKEILPLGQFNAYSYDAADNLKERITANGHKVVYSYDAENRLIEAKYYRNGTALERTSTFVLDDTDNLTAWSDIDHTRNQTSSGTMVFDDANRRTSDTTNFPGGFSLNYGYGYSPAGYKTQITWPDTTQLTYGYSDHGVLQSVAIPGEGSISVNQFKWTEPAKVTLPGGITQERTLDGLFNLEGLKVKTPTQQTVLSVANSFGKLLELKQSQRTDSVNGVSRSLNGNYTYDDEIRLTKAVIDNGAGNTETETFKLDGAGNRIAHSKVPGAWQYDGNNRLTQRGTGENATTYEYDEAGNLTKKIEPGSKITQYLYDTQDRLIEVKDGTGNSIARYGYDPFDQRIWKEQFRARDGSVLAQAKRTFYLYSDEGLLAEASQDITLNPDQSTSNVGAPAISAQYGPQPDASFTTALLFVKTKNSNGQDSFGYFHHNEIGTPIQATDKAGNVVWSVAYNVFGQATVTTPQAVPDKPTITSNLRLPGQIEDLETGLHYNYRRYYDPETGRYITQDPIGIASDLNLYRYAANDPINLIDPTGELVPAVVVAVDIGLAYATCVAECTAVDVAINAIAGECTSAGDSLKSCAKECLLGPLGALAGKAGKWFGRAKDFVKSKWDNRLEDAVCSLNSFPGDTLVHVKPKGAKSADAKIGNADLKPISELQVGDEVLALAEWKSKNGPTQGDDRLSYEKVTDIFTSLKEQKLVHLTLDNGQILTSTEGHPFKTVEGWRDAILLKKGGQLLLKGVGSDVAVENIATIIDLRIAQKFLPVFNIDVAMVHTYFVGENGQLVHNGRCTPAMRRAWEKLHNKQWPKNPLTEKIRPGGNQDGHHILHKSKGGSDDPSNIEPMTPSQHIAHHKKHGR